MSWQPEPEPHHSESAQSHKMNASVNTSSLRIISFQNQLAALQIQRVWRGSRTREIMWDYGGIMYETRVIRVQKRWRGVLDRRIGAELWRLRVLQCAHKVQGLYYMWHSRRTKLRAHLTFLEKGVVLMQSYFRMRAAIRLSNVVRLAQHTKLATRIQSGVRRMIWRIKYMERRKRYRYIHDRMVTMIKENTRLAQMLNVASSEYMSSKSNGMRSNSDDNFTNTATAVVAVKSGPLGDLSKRMVSFDDANERQRRQEKEDEEREKEEELAAAANMTSAAAMLLELPEKVDNTKDLALGLERVLCFLVGMGKYPNALQLGSFIAGFAGNMGIDQDRVVQEPGYRRFMMKGCYHCTYSSHSLVLGSSNGLSLTASYLPLAASWTRAGRTRQMRVAFFEEALGLIMQHSAVTMFKSGIMLTRRLHERERCKVEEERLRQEEMKRQEALEQEQRGKVGGKKKKAAIVAVAADAGDDDASVSDLDDEMSVSVEEESNRSESAAKEEEGGESDSDSDSTSIGFSREGKSNKRRRRKKKKETITTGENVVLKANERQFILTDPITGARTLTTLTVDSHHRSRDAYSDGEEEEDEDEQSLAMMASRSSSRFSRRSGDRSVATGPGRSRSNWKTPRDAQPRFLQNLNEEITEMYYMCARRMNGMVSLYDAYLLTADWIWYRTCVEEHFEAGVQFVREQLEAVEAEEQAAIAKKAEEERLKQLEEEEFQRRVRAAALREEGEEGEEEVGVAAGGTALAIGKSLADLVSHAVDNSDMVDSFHRVDAGEEEPNPAEVAAAMKRNRAIRQVYGLLQRARALLSPDSPDMLEVTNRIEVFHDLNMTENRSLLVDHDSLPVAYRTHHYLEVELAAMKRAFSREAQERRQAAIEERRKLIGTPLSRRSTSLAGSSTGRRTLMSSRATLTAGAAAAAGGARTPSALAEFPGPQEEVPTHLQVVLCGKSILIKGSIGLSALVKAVDRVPKGYKPPKGDPEARAGVGTGSAAVSRGGTGSAAGAVAASSALDPSWGVFFEGVGAEAVGAGGTVVGVGAGDGVDVGGGGVSDGINEEDLTLPVARDMVVMIRPMVLLRAEVDYLISTITPTGGNSKLGGTGSAKQGQSMKGEAGGGGAAAAGGGGGEDDAGASAKAAGGGGGGGGGTMHSTADFERLAAYLLTHIRVVSCQEKFLDPIHQRLAHTLRERNYMEAVLAEEEQRLAKERSKQKREAAAETSAKLGVLAKYVSAKKKKKTTNPALDGFGGDDDDDDDSSSEDEEERARIGRLLAMSEKNKQEPEDGKGDKKNDETANNPETLDEAVPDGGSSSVSIDNKENDEMDFIINQMEANKVQFAASLGPVPAARFALPILEYRRRLVNESQLVRHSTLLLQRLYRGFQGRAKFRRLQWKRREYIRHQTNTQRLRDQMEALRQWRGTQVTVLQKLWRGYRWRKLLDAMKRYSLLVQCTFRVFRAKMRLAAERKRRAEGAPVESMLGDGRGVQVGEMKFTLKMYRSGTNYRLEGVDLLRGATYEGNVYTQEVLRLIHEHNANFTGSTLFANSSRIMPWQHERVTELIIRNLALMPSLRPITNQFGASAPRQEWVLVTNKNASVYAPPLQKAPTYTQQHGLAMSASASVLDTANRHTQKQRNERYIQYRYNSHFQKKKAQQLKK